MQAPGKDTPDPCNRHPANRLSLPKHADQPIVLLGASIRSAAESAQRAGFRVIGIDQFGDQDTAAACERLHVVSKTAQIDDLILQHSGLAVHLVGGFRLARSSTQLSMLNRHLILLDDPETLREITRGSGIGFPETVRDRSQLNCADLRCRWLVKQRQSCGGLGVRWLDDPSEIRWNNEFVQRWVKGRNFGVTFLSDGCDVRFLGICRSLFRRLGDFPFVYSGSFGPIDWSPTQRERYLCRLLRLARQVVERTGFSGIFNLDIVIDRTSEIWLLEINPRWSGSSELVERSLIDRGLLENKSLFFWGDQAVRCESLPSSEDLESWTSPVSSYYKQICYSRRQFQFDGLPSELNEDSSVTVHDIPQHGTMIKCGDPVCTLIYRVDTRAGSLLAHVKRHPLGQRSRA